MFRRINGDIFKSGCDVLVNPVNCVGVSGKGLAKAFAERFPHNTTAYTQWTAFPNCVFPGDSLVVRNKDGFIINVATKDHWKNSSQLLFIERCVDSIFRDIIGICFSYNIKSIAIPALGCGCGELRWDDVLKVITDGLTRVFNIFPWIDIEIFEPLGG